MHFAPCPTKAECNPNGMCAYMTAVCTDRRSRTMTCILCSLVVVLQALIRNSLDVFHTPIIAWLAMKRGNEATTR